MRASVAAALAACASVVVTGQAPVKERFEAATIRPFAPEPSGTGFPSGVGGGPGSANPRRVVYTNLTLENLVMLAYNVKQYQVSAPEWMDSIVARFTIEGTVRPGATQQQVNRMLQSLLAERFKLMLHRETKEAAVQELAVVAGGPKLKNAVLGPKSRPRIVQELIAKDGARKIIATAQTVEQLADLLSVQASSLLGGPVLNKTGLTGKYDFVLEYAASPSEIETMQRAGFPDAAERAAHQPDLSGALQQQLGLKLEAKQEPMEMLVVDHCEKKPTEK